MTKLIALAVCWFTFIQAQVPGPVCSCNDNPPFLTVAPASPLVSLVKIKKYLTFKDIYGNKTPMSMEVEIIDTYHGKEDRKLVTVWGDPGHLCRPYLSTFKEDGYYVIAFYTAGKYGEEKETEYAISICGTYWLTVDYTSKIAKGDIDGKKDSLSLDAIRSTLAVKTP